MSQNLHSWRLVEPGKPLELQEASLPVPGPDEVLLKVRACGLCHTDHSFVYGGVRTKKALPLTLGHEIVGDAIAAGPGADGCVGLTYIVPAVIPCGDCELCERGRGNICRKQIMPGNDIDGGFASHIVVPARGLCPVPPGFADIEVLSVIADAVSTAYQAVSRCEVGIGDLVVIVGAGGVGGYACQIAKARGAHVVAIDIDASRLETVAASCARVIDASTTSTKAIRAEIQELERSYRGSPRLRIIECSGTRAGQETAYALLSYDATLAIVGFTMDKVELRLSNLMAFDATVFGNWGCLPEHYPKILEHVRTGDVILEPTVERHPMSALNELLQKGHHERRPVLIPDFD